MAQGEYNLNFKSFSQKTIRDKNDGYWSKLDSSFFGTGRFIFWSNSFFSNKENVKSAKAKTQIDIEEKMILKTK